MPKGEHHANKTHCAKGHPFSGDNLYVDERGWRKCRTCMNDVAKRYYRRNTQARRAYRRRWKEAKGEEYFRDLHLQSNYGITLEEYERMREAQNDLCAICKSPAPASKRHSGLVVDHCHDSGKIRGLVCHTCNAALGLARNDPKVLRAMADYLSK